MKHAALAAAAGLLMAAAPLSVALDDADGQFEPIAGVSPDAVNANCLACHSAAMVRYQPALSPRQWQETLAKMRTVYKAPIDPAEDAAILAWLNALSAAQQVRQGLTAQQVTR